MSILEALKNNKGTVSSALGKELAQQALAGEMEILREAIDLCTWKLPDMVGKNVRAGAAKTVESVAEKSPDLVAAKLEQLLPALEAPEPQTRWMVLRIFGFCATARPEVAEQAIPSAEEVLLTKEGLIVASSADLYLGEMGAVSTEYARKVFPILARSAATVIRNEADWILEAFIAMSAKMDADQCSTAMDFAARHLGDARKSTAGRARKLTRLLGD